MAELNVKTISGKTVPRANTIKIREKYHEKNVDCFRINDRWVSSHFNNIHLDAATENFNFSSKLSAVLLSHTADFKQTSVGMSSKTFGEPFCLYDKEPNSFFQAIDEEQYKNLNLIKCKVSGQLYPKGISPFKTSVKYNREKHDFHYAVTLEKGRSMGIPEEKLEDFGLISKTFKKTGLLKYKFGVEIETSGGVIAKQLANGQLNIDYVYDGSVYSKDGEKYGGGEIVTGILNGDSGIAHLKKVMEIAEERCEVNPTCGLHVHIGDFKPTDEFAINAYMLGLLLQNDIFRHLPKKRRFQVDYKGNITGNNNPYCKFLPPVTLYKYEDAKNKKDYSEVLYENYKEVFKKIADGIEVSEKYNKNTDHPKGKKCGYDHNSMRYSWLNMVPTIFKTRKDNSRTLEFRPHCETLSFTKTYYWVLFCMAFVRFCEKNTSNIFRNKDDDGNPLTIDFILYKAYSGKLLNDVLTYYENRREYFGKNDKALENDFTNYQRIV